MNNERREALKEGRTRYYTGLPCKHGHDSERFVSSGGCVDCVNPSTGRKPGRPVNQELKAQRELEKDFEKAISQATRLEKLAARRAYLDRQISLVGRPRKCKESPATLAALARLP